LQQQLRRVAARSDKTGRVCYYSPFLVHGCCDRGGACCSKTIQHNVTKQLSAALVMFSRNVFQRCKPDTTCTHDVAQMVLPNSGNKVARVLPVVPTLS
jgi:hypothetical protein